MSDTVISVENLSKRYRIGAKEEGYKTFREAIIDGFTAPIKNLRRLRKLTKFDDKSGKKPDPMPSAPGSLPSSSDDTIWALRDVSFEVKQGEVVGIIGRNGAGKTTLLKILSRITEPTMGDVRLYGRVSSLLEVGTGFHPELTGRENIYLNGAILGMRKEEIIRKFDEIVDFADIVKFLDTPVKRYSSGMYVRLAFAVAAHLEPEILLVDEVLAVGDTEFQKKCLGKMEEVAEGGKTVLFVSHNMIAVKSLCSKAILLHEGRLLSYENVTSVIERYLSEEKNLNGEIAWRSPEDAPGNYEVRLKAVRIVSDNQVNGSPSVSKDIEVQIDFWNLEKDARRLISIHVLNGMGYILLTSGNIKSASIVPDPWAEKKYPKGLFRTKCVIPRFLLNPGRHSIDLYINGRMAHDNIILKKGIISFDVKEAEELRTDYLREWIGAVRPILHWETCQIK